MTLQTLESIWSFFSLWERFHPEYTEEECTEFLHNLIRSSDDPECKQLVETFEKKAKVMKIETDLLQKYADEMGVGYLTLKELIKSHKELRNTNKNVEAARQKAVSDGYNYGLELGRDFALKNKWISREELRPMKLIDLANQIWGESK